VHLVPSQAFRAVSLSFESIPSLLTRIFILCATSFFIRGVWAFCNSVFAPSPIFEISFLLVPGAAMPIYKISNEEVLARTPPVVAFAFPLSQLSQPPFSSGVRLPALTPLGTSLLCVLFGWQFFPRHLAPPPFGARIFSCLFRSLFPIDFPVRVIYLARVTLSFKFFFLFSRCRFLKYPSLTSLAESTPVFL